MFHSLTCRKWMGRPVSWLLQKVCSPWSSSRTSRTVRWRRKNHLRCKTITPSHHIKEPLRQRTWTRPSIQQRATSSPFSARLLLSSVVVSRHLRNYTWIRQQMKHQEIPNYREALSHPQVVRCAAREIHWRSLRLLASVESSSPTSLTWAGSRTRTLQAQF